MVPHDTLRCPDRANGRASPGCQASMAGGGDAGVRGQGDARTAHEARIGGDESPEQAFKFTAAGGRVVLKVRTKERHTSW
jgi:hypothetical protein